MCGVIGACLVKPTPDDFETLRRLFIESKIRGLHATGIAWVQNGWVQKKIMPVPADEFTSKVVFEDKVNEDGNLYLIGHTRYSTSDLEYNQPLGDLNMAAVHNGVISQELVENWEREYGYKCETRNDTELLVHSVRDGKVPFEAWPEASISAIELHFDKRMRFYRNGKRPLHGSLVPGSLSLFLASTRDILNRAGLEDNLEIEHNTVYPNWLVAGTKYDGHEDLQRDL